MEHLSESLIGGAISMIGSVVICYVALVSRLTAIETKMDLLMKTFRLEIGHELRGRSHGDN